MKRIHLHRSITAVAAALTAWHLSRRTFAPEGRLSRKSLIKLGGLGLASLTGAAWKVRWATAAVASTIAPAKVTCILTPELTVGPYYIAREKVRSNIRENRPGTPLKLKLAVVDASTCKPIKNAAVDIWHCDAGGIYSGFISASTGGPGGPGGNSGPTDKHTFLRGIQLTNAHGIATFESVYPGWYRGRTVHIHVKVHLAGDTVGHVVHTGQLFFADSLTAKVYQTGVYASRASARDTFNATDSIYKQGGKQSTLTLKRDGHGGYIAAITMGVKRA